MAKARADIREGRYVGISDVSVVGTVIIAASVSRWGR